MSLFRQVIDKILAKKNSTIISNSIEVEISPYSHQAYHFGYKSCWYVVRSGNAEEVAQYVKELASTSLQVALFRVPGWKVDISSSYNGWVFLLCELVPDEIRSVPDFKTFLTLLSERFGEAQFFGTHRVVEYHCWAKALRGKIVRLYSYVGEIGENIVVEGEPTEVEKKFNFVNTFSPEARTGDYFENPALVSPDETTVMKIAESWSCNPTKFSAEDFQCIWTNALVVRRTK